MLREGSSPELTQLQKWTSDLHILDKSSTGSDTMVMLNSRCGVLNIPMDCLKSLLTIGVGLTEAMSEHKGTTVNHDSLPSYEVRILAR